MDPQVPLVVSEVNPDALERIERGIVANPNCTTMAIMLPLKALHDAFGLRAIVATSFQAAGGAGQKGMDELAAQVPLLHDAREQLVSDGAAAIAAIEHSVHAAPLAYNVVPWLGSPAARRLQRRGDEARQRVAQDPRAPRPAGQPDLRARAGDGRPLRSRSARPSSARRSSRRRARRSRRSRASCSTSCRRPFTTPAATRSRSGASAPTSATRTR